MQTEQIERFNRRDAEDAEGDLTLSIFSLCSLHLCGSIIFFHAFSMLFLGGLFSDNENLR
jgi:hypothetical protein